MDGSANVLTTPLRLIPLALLVSLAMAQGQNTVTGTATYLERIALPPDAVFEATLEDVSRAGAPAEIIGQTRKEKPGQPPFQFSIAYDPARIVEGRSYSVRARVTVDGNLMFITDQSYPVLTRGKGNQVAMMIMRRARPSTNTSLGALPASFSGELPCADCSGIRYVLNLFPDNSFFLRMTYAGRGEAKPNDDIGRWNLSSDGATLILKGGKESSDKFTVKSSDTLRKLDLEGREIDSKLNYDLKRTSVFERIEPRMLMNGMFRYMADAATFTECQTGQRWPVAMEGGYKMLESAYLQTRLQAGQELMVNVEGQVAMRPSPDGGRPTPTLVVERYMGIWPGETCGAPFATTPLQETYWKLTRLEGKPVILVEKQREPSLVLRSEQNRATGFSGCNTFTGSYQLNGSEMTFGSIAATRKACLHGMETEGLLFKVLDRVREWRITGQHLELSDAGGNLLARFEARALR